MITVDLNQNIQEIEEGKGLVELAKDKTRKLSMVLAEMLKTSQKGDAIKYLDWAIDLAQKGKIEVDNSDYDSLMTFIKEHQQLMVLVKAQLIKAFKQAKEVKPSKKAA